jgi:hypothetical protein
VARLDHRRLRSEPINALDSTTGKKRGVAQIALTDMGKTHTVRSAREAPEKARGKKQGSRPLSPTTSRILS